MRVYERSYPALISISVLLKALALFIAAAGIISAITAPFAVAAPVATEAAIVIGILVGAAIPALVLYAVADLILVVVDIERNTFLAGEALQARVGAEVVERKAPGKRRAA